MSDDILLSVLPTGVSILRILSPIYSPPLSGTRGYRGGGAQFQIGCMVRTIADVWYIVTVSPQCGCLISELITGKPPYFDLPPMSAIFQIVQPNQPPFPEEDL